MVVDVGAAAGGGAGGGAGAVGGATRAGVTARTTTGGGLRMRASRTRAREMGCSNFRDQTEMHCEHNSEWVKKEQKKEKRQCDKAPAIAVECSRVFQ